VQSHGGSIRYEPSDGFCVRMIFPMMKDRRWEASARDALHRYPNRLRFRILFYLIRSWFPCWLESKGVKKFFSPSCKWEGLFDEKRLTKQCFDR
jgi:hypothetical protein